MTGRIHGLDVARGLAVLSMCYVHVMWFGHPTEYVGDILTSFERWLFTLGRVLIHGKVTSLFALLFGYGLALQVASLLRRDVAVRPFLLRRLGFIGLIGAVHGLFFWHGDILLIYSLCALVVVACYDRSVQWFLCCGGVVVAICWMLAGSVAGGLIWQSVQPGVFASGDWFYMLVARVWLFTHNLANPVNLYVLGSILLGYGLGRWGLHERVKALRRLTLWFGLAWLGWSLAGIQAQLVGNAEQWWFLYLVSAPIGGLFYMSACLWLVRRPVRILSAYGQMSLSNYLAQTLVLIAVFYSLRLYGSVGPALALVLSLLVMAGQLAVSLYWFERFGVGPVEGWVKARLKNRKYQVADRSRETFVSKV